MRLSTPRSSAALDYYRATIGPLFRPPFQAEPTAPMPSAPIDVPAIIYGMNDGCIGAELLEGMASHFPRGLKTELVADAGHFVHQENPAAVNRTIIDFLKG